MKSSLHLGVIFALMSTLSYSILAAIVKQFNGDLPLPQVVFIQCGISLLIMSTLIGLRGKHYIKSTLKTSYPLLHLVRAIFSLGISYFLFYAVVRIPLVDAVLLSNTSPFMVPFLSLILWKQPINHRLWAPILVGFAGVMLTLKPEGAAFDIANLLPLGSAFCIAMALMLVRKMTQKDSTVTIGLYFFLFATLISGFVALSTWVPLTYYQWGIMLFIGFLYFTCQYCLSVALRYAKAEIVSSLYYSNILYSTLISILWFQAEISYLLLIGMIMIVISGIMCVWTDSRTKNSKQARHRHRQQDLA